jgi:hypothetical protein
MSVRRLLLLALLIAAGAATFKRVRDQRSAQTAAPPEWPPFEPRIVERSPDQPGASGSDPRAPGLAEGWVVPAADGSTPEGYPVKVKISSGIFHVPGGRFYDRTTADRCYPSAAAAEADGYRPSKS